nr:PEP-CTERM sorting domain-containing protein [Janthinobacterium sp. CG3]
MRGGVQAVPEPAGYAMLFAGLGLLGFTARRRRGVAR